jgi:hypothetical protein
MTPNTRLARRPDGADGFGVLGYLKLKRKLQHEHLL